MTHERLGQITIDSSDNSEFYLEVSEHDEKELCLRETYLERCSEKIAHNDKQNGDIVENEDAAHFVMHTVDNAFKEHRFTVDYLPLKVHTERKLSENSTH
jgi:preprotein translocase subunit SecA